MTPRETGLVIRDVAALWPNFEANDRSVPVWHGVLEGFDVDVVQEALSRLAKNGREFAPPAGVVWRTCRSVLRWREHAEEALELANKARHAISVTPPATLSAAEVRPVDARGLAKHLGREL